jgi:L-ribulose-5-phosphate 3-epimerase
MNQLKLGIVLETTGLPVRQALAAASALGVRGVQIDATGALAPEHLSATGRRELQTLLRGAGLELSALNCPSRRALDDPAAGSRFVDHLRGVMLLASDLACPCVIVALPGVPDAADDPRASAQREALRSLAACGDRIGTRVALDTGAETAERVRDYLDSFDTDTLNVNFDPTDALRAGSDPLSALEILFGRVIHTRARDVRSAAGGRWHEVALGTGDTDWGEYLSALEAVGYGGYVVVDRASVPDRFDDVVSGVRYLERLVPVAA